MTYLATVDAIMNGFSLFFISLGFFFIKRKNKKKHVRCMMLAVLSSTIFLGCYLFYHFLGEPIKYAGNHPDLYYSILVSHIILAAFVPFLVGFVLFQAFKNNLVRHKQIARITLPIWAYVSVTGILIYLMVHKLSF